VETFVRGSEEAHRRSAFPAAVRRARFAYRLLRPDWRLAPLGSVAAAALLGLVACSHTGPTESKACAESQNAPVKAEAGAARRPLLAFVQAADLQSPSSAAILCPSGRSHRRSRSVSTKARGALRPTGDTSRSLFLRGKAYSRLRGLCGGASASTSSI
jgi:hypothetical protein